MVPLVLAVIQNSTMSTVEKLQAGQSKFWMCYVQTIRVLATAFTLMAPLIKVFHQSLLKLIFHEPFVIKIASQHLSQLNKQTLLDNVPISETFIPKANLR